MVSFFVSQKRVLASVMVAALALMSSPASSLVRADQYDYDKEKQRAMEAWDRKLRKINATKRSTKKLEPKEPDTDKSQMNLGF